MSCVAAGRRSGCASCSAPTTGWSSPLAATTWSRRKERSASPLPAVWTTWPRCWIDTRSGRSGRPPRWLHRATNREGFRNHLRAPRSGRLVYPCLEVLWVRDHHVRRGVSASVPERRRGDRKGSTMRRCTAVDDQHRTGLRLKAGGPFRRTAADCLLTSSEVVLDGREDRR
jgi:hypothetical protein